MKITSVFIHGMWSRSKRMEFWRSRLSQRMEAHAINLDRSNITQKRIGDYVRQVESFLSSLSTDKIVIVGHSMGGLLAQKAEDARIERRILAAPALPKGIFSIDNFTQIFSMLGQLNQSFRRKTTLPTKFWSERLIFNMHKTLGLKWDHKELVPQSYRAFEETLFGIPVLKRSNVHIFVGSRDLITPPRAQKRLAQYHDATLKIFPEQDHCSICQSEEVAGYIVELASGDQNAAAL